MPDHPPNAAPGSLRERAQRLGHAVSQQPHLMSVRDGVVGSLPLILLGSLFLLLLQPPWPALSKYLPDPAALRAGWTACAGLVSLYVCAATALALARRRTVDAAAAVTTGLAVFLVAQLPAPLQGGGSGLRISVLGAAGLFPAFAAAIFAVEALAFFQKRNWSIQLGGGAPEVVVKSFAALLPTAFCVGVVWVLVHLLHIDLAGGISSLVAPLVHASDALPALLAIVLIDSCLWMLGVHGLSVLAAVRPLWLAALTANQQALLAGQQPVHLGTQEFFVWFVWQGGSGTTLALALLLVFARSRQLRVVARAGFVPALFNINEPLLFGVPVVLNGKLAIPFIAVPATLVCTSWAAFRAGLVRVPTAEVVWTLPAPIGAFLSTGGDWRGVALQLFNLALACAIWWPFVRRLDRTSEASAR